MSEEPGLFEALIGDGRPLLTFFGVSLVVLGGFAIFLAASGHFLPHDVAYLGMTAEQLCSLRGCRIVHFMEHDRVAFGGSLIATGSMYVWLSEFPLRRGEAWSWWLFVLSGIVGFTSFLGYLGYGYLDTWHGTAALGLLAPFICGLALTYKLIRGPAGVAALLKPSERLSLRSSSGIGRISLLATSAGMIAAGLVITTVGTTIVFVPQDLEFMGVAVNDLHEINPRLVSLIAHDRAGFGGGICACGVTVLFSVWCGEPSKSLWQALCVAGVAGFATAIGVHPVVGYTDLTHLAPAFAGALMFLFGLVMTYRPMNAPQKASRLRQPDARPLGR